MKIIDYYVRDYCGVQDLKGVQFIVVWVSKFKIIVCGFRIEYMSKYIGNNESYIFVCWRKELKNMKMEKIRMNFVIINQIGGSSMNVQFLIQRYRNKIIVRDRKMQIYVYLNFVVFLLKEFRSRVIFMVTSKFSFYILVFVYYILLKKLEFFREMVEFRVMVEKV